VESVIVQKNVYSLFKTPLATFIVATVVVLLWDTFWILSIVAEDVAVVKSSPEARIVSVE
tara:strand:- start:386 stop:565 length:180 start_codon:yes stop_codon:yes gene_type:complete